MLRPFVHAALAACAVLALAAPRAAAADEVRLPQTQERVLVSRAGLKYRIFIAKPQAPPPAAGYPVVYVLDGNAVAGMLADFSRTQTRSQGGLLSPAVLVAIGYPGDAPFNMERRARDLTPVPATPGKGAWTYLAPEQTGGADAFLDFIEDELKPAIAADFPVDAGQQTLMGHSFGGLFALHVLLTRPDAFSTYVAASPSLWWADGAIQDEVDAFAARPPAGHRRLLVTVGAYEQALHPGLRGRSDAADLAGRLAARRMVDAARALAERLAAVPGQPVAVTFKVIEGQTHVSAAPYALLLGLEAALGPQP